MKVLITGATGLVGKAITQECLKQGIVVHYLTTSKKKIISKKDYKGFYWNPAQGEIDEACFEGVQSIIHLAGASIAQKWTVSNKKIIKESRIKSAGLLFDTLERFRDHGNPSTVKHIISASGIGCYPSSPTKFYNEKYPNYATDFLGEVVQEWEQAAIEFQQLDIATSIIRMGIVLDGREGALAKITKPVKLYAGAPLGTGKQWQSWIHIDDIARLYVHVLTNELIGVYNGVAPNPVTNEKLTRAVAQRLKKPLFLPNVPKVILKMLLGEMGTIALQSQMVSSEKIEETGFVFGYTSIEKAIEDLL
ncbi:TIGR01777 family oxidoreductase [Dokdonia sp.]|uniref:TIGR01777 family oxidoreductase n=1 Tax=Dokdonia sp. TaxID=2024995 RepID=UPI003266D114